MHRIKYLILAFIFGIISFLLLKPIAFPYIAQISTKLGYTPPGCYYDKIVCIKAPCPPILICPSPTVNPQTDPTVNWKTYKNNKVGYSLKAPPTWTVKQNKDDSLLFHQDYVANMTLSLDPEPGPFGKGYMAIVFPILIQGPHHDMGKNFENGLKGLEIKPLSESSNVFSRTASSYTQIDGKKALVTIQVYKTTPPVDFRGSWCNCTHKHVYVDLGNGKILDIFGYWQNNNADFEKSFDEILSTFKFLDVTPTPTCRPRPACLDSTPRCFIAETSDMCPPGR